ncbi:hypothetical protein GC167_00175 [bacterium]|nr:hypothetical protein [bacterium]
MPPKDKVQRGSTVRLVTFSNLTTAQVAASVLRAEGVACTIEHELLHSVLPHSGLSPTGIGLRVALDDAHRAFDVLEPLFPGEWTALEF